MVLASPKSRKEARWLRELVAQENHDRVVLMRRALQLSPELSTRDLSLGASGLPSSGASGGSARRSDPARGRNVDHGAPAEAAGTAVSVVVPRLAAYLLSVGLLLAEGSCGSTSSRPTVVLREYRITQPRRALAAYSRLGSSASDEVAGSLSPDGKRLLYADNNKGQFDVWVKDLTTGLPRRLTRHVSEDTQPAWAPDGERVVFVSMRHDAKGDLYLWDDGDLKRLTDSKTADAYPVFAPDGRSVYFASGPFGRPRVERLWLDSGKRETLGPAQSTHPSVSPDGKLLAFTAFDRKGRGQIHLLRLSDRKSWTLTTPDYASGFPTFSADGKSILFCRFFRGRPGVPRDDSAMASLWSIPLSAALAGSSPERLMQEAEQLTSDRHGVILPRSHQRGIVITVYGMESLDLALIPQSGLLASRRLTPGIVVDAAAPRRIRGTSCWCWADCVVTAATR